MDVNKGERESEGTAKITMSEELAEAEIRRWAEMHDIDLTTQDANGEEVFDAVGVRKLVKAIQQGRLVVNDEGNLDYTISKNSPEGIAGEKITIKPATAASYMAMDTYSDAQSVHRTLAVAAGMTGKTVNWLGKLANYDYKILVRIVSFFILA